MLKLEFVVYVDIVESTLYVNDFVPGEEMHARLVLIAIRSISSVYSISTKSRCLDSMCRSRKIGEIKLLISFKKPLPLNM